MGKAVVAVRVTVVPVAVDMALAAMEPVTGGTTVVTAPETVGCVTAADQGIPVQTGNRQVNAVG